MKLKYVDTGETWQYGCQEPSWPLSLIKANSFTVKLTTAVSTSMSHSSQEEREMKLGGRGG